MSIALDAMGGDHAPKEIVAGALEALPDLKTTLFLVGAEREVMPLLPKPIPRNLEFVHASQWVDMDEKPSEAFRKKKDSSLMVGAKLVQEGRAQALVSAGNTGAATAISLLVWRQVAGIHRPAIASRIPNAHGGFVLLDAGASPDVDPENLLEFAIMGRAYAEKVMGRRNPSVHLLNIGEEEGKGNAFAKQSYHLLAKHDWFAGNIEGKDMYAKPCDVVVCDAFVGNVVLKTSEGVAELVMKTIRESVPRGGIGRMLYWPLKSVMNTLKKELDYAESGGAPLLGLNGLCIICHGRSNARAIRNALLIAQRANENHLTQTIRDWVQRDLGVTVA
jgi:glycerol-3-phosphate acyltransferase PlsX